MTVATKSAPAPGGTARHARTVLISVIGLHLVAETALTPFLPQLFARLYGIEDPGATGLYIWICRIAGLAALPLWGLAARRWPLHQLVLAGLCGTAVLDLLLGMAPSYAAYTTLSTLIVMTNSALLLAYPAFIAEYGDASEGGERARLTGVCTLVVVFHLSVVVSTMVGAGVLALPEPRIGISAFALLDALLAVFTYRILGRSRDGKSAAPDGYRDASGGGPTATEAQLTDAAPAAALAAAAGHGSPVPAGGGSPLPAGHGSPVPAGGGLSAPAGGGSPEPAAPDPAAPAPAAPATAGTPSAPGGRGRTSRLTWFTMLAYAALIGVAFDFSVNVARPFFTEFSEGLGSGSVGSAVLFFLPSVSALAVLPLVRRCHDRFGDRLLPLALTVAAAGMAWSWLADSLPELVGGRLLFGVGLGLGQVAVELRMFRATGTEGPAFTAVETVRSAGLLAAPLAATAAVSSDLALPLAVAAAVQLCAAALSVRRFKNAAPAPSVRAVPAAPVAVHGADPLPQAAGPEAASASVSPRSGAGDRTPSLMAPASPPYSEENHR
ncbi:hypothetical protein [Streptomyces sp. NPDC058657]|uniref:hypothetical protein n=1 Tax=unclassified Streptomyces TaxID=2593676 RepID=UPI00365FDF95